MAVEFDIGLIYRGPLKSCNYACSYCPFAKGHDDRQALRQDAEALERFVNWVRRNKEQRLGVLFTPWGEALIRQHYRDAMLELASLPHVTRVAAQTNLSYTTEWLRSADREATALWCTFHPSQTQLQDFLSQCRGLDELGIRYSVGAVGLKGDFQCIRALRASLNPAVYLWVNAYKREANYYRPENVAFLRQIDPHFDLNNQVHDSAGQFCSAGEQVVTVDGEGTVRRCHFVDTPLGNLYVHDLRDMLAPRPCPNTGCGCHIGYVHLKPLGLHQTFAGGVLERVPALGPG